MIGLSIASSLLVQTVIAGGHAYWGCIVMAVGKSGEPIAETDLEIHVAGHAVALDDAPPPGYVQAPVACHMAGHQILTEVAVATATVWI